jgi:hypothetical protein
MIFLRRWCNSPKPPWADLIRPPSGSASGDFESLVRRVKPADGGKGEVSNSLQSQINLLASPWADLIRPPSGSTSGDFESLVRRVKPADGGRG